MFVCLSVCLYLRLCMCVCERESERVREPWWWESPDFPRTASVWLCEWVCVCVCERERALMTSVYQLRTHCKGVCVHTSVYLFLCLVSVCAWERGQRDKEKDSLDDQCLGQIRTHCKWHCKCVGECVCVCVCVCQCERESPHNLSVRRLCTHCMFDFIFIFYVWPKIIQINCAVLHLLMQRDDRCSLGCAHTAIHCNTL